MKEIFSYTKLFTILITIFYILGLIGCFYHCNCATYISAFVLFGLLIFFFELDFKKIIILFLMFMFAIIRAGASTNLPTILDEINSNNTSIFGQIITSKDVSAKDNKTKFFIKATSASIDNKKYKNLNTKILISLDNICDFSIGDYVSLSGKLRSIKPSSNPYQFDYQRYLLNNDVKNILYATSIKKIKNPELKSDFWYFLLKKFEKTRENILEKHSKNIKSPRLEILGGIVFGSETINPDEEIKENFKNSGLLHLLAASGLNVALIYGIWWWLATLIRFPYNLSILTGATLVIFYTFMTGFPPSILRASAMLLFVLLGKIIDRNANSLALIFFVGFLMLVFSPKMLFDVGFQLSFIVTIGLVVCMPVILDKFKKSDEKYREKYKKVSRFKKYILFLFSPMNLAAIVAIPLIAQIFVIPLQMHYFNNFAPYSILANIAVVPFIGILSFIGFVSSIFALLPFLNNFMIGIFDFIANPLLALLIKISEIFSSFKFSLITTVGLNNFQMFAYWSIVLLFILNLKNNFKNKKQIIVLILSLFLLLFSFIKPINHNLEISMFDVDNADCFLIKTPQNKYIMIDTGKKSYRGLSDFQMILNKYLKNERINTLEALIITHFDLDHCSGTVDILKNFKVKKVIIKNENIDSAISKEILKYLKENKINYQIAKTVSEVYFENDLKIKTYSSNIKNDNESSIVTLLNYKNKNILFMGDTGIVGFKDIAKYFNKVDILKIGHHGAKNSINNEMLDKLKPEYALISVGFNKFNHPHFSTINLLEDRNINIISTRNYGFVKTILKENDFKFYHYDSELKKIKELEFINKEKFKFHESDFFKNFVKENSN